MKMTSKRIYAIWAGVHFFLITVICLRGIFALVATHATILPSALNRYARSGEVVLASVLGKDLAASNPWRLGVATYLHAAGSQAGYGFFAPNIPGYHKLILELHYHDGHMEYDVPHVQGSAAALRVDSLLDRLADPLYEPLREVTVKMLALSVWQKHPDVKNIRAVFGSVNMPSISDFEHGKREAFQALFSYDFSLRNEENDSTAQ
jgi:hypothetical protein